MPPTLRSAQSSPASKGSNINDVSPNVTPGRKVPRCTQCGRLRQGHPRSGCPYSESPAKNADTGPVGIKPKTLQENLSEALGSMYLDSPPPAPDEKAPSRALKRRSFGTPPIQISESLASISTSAEDMLNDLVKPVFFSQATVLEDDGIGSSRRDDDAAIVNTPTKARIKSGPRTLMPGTLMAPSWESSIGGFQDLGAARENADRAPDQRVVSKNSLGVQTSLRRLDGEAAPPPSSQSPSLTSARLLESSQPVERRDQFLHSLSHKSPASVYTYRKEDIDELQASAEALRFHVRIIDDENEGGEEALLVIGSDLQTVERLAEELGTSIRVAAATKSKGGTTTNNIFITNTTPTGGTADVRSSSSTTLKAVAGGAIVGAVGTWAGLAFS